MRSAVPSSPLMMMSMLAVLQALPHDLTGGGAAPDPNLWADNDDEDHATGTLPAQLVGSPVTPASSVIVVDDDAASPSGTILMILLCQSPRLCRLQPCKADSRASPEGHNPPITCPGRVQLRRLCFDCSLAAV